MHDSQDYFIGGSAYPERIGSFLYPASFGYKPLNPDPAYSPIQSGGVDNELKEFYFGYLFHLTK